MATTKGRNVSGISVALNPNGPKKQTRDSINKLIAQVLGRAGCDECGRIAYIDLGFLGDPEQEFERLGAISVDVRVR